MSQGRYMLEHDPDLHIVHVLGAENTADVYKSSPQEVIDQRRETLHAAIGMCRDEIAALRAHNAPDQRLEHWAGMLSAHEAELLRLNDPIPTIDRHYADTSMAARLRETTR